MSRRMVSLIGYRIFSEMPEPSATRDETKGLTLTVNQLNRGPIQKAAIREPSVHLLSISREQPRTRISFVVAGDAASQKSSSSVT